LPRCGVRPVSMPYVRILSRPSTRCCHLVSSFSTRRLFRAPSRSPPLEPFGSSRLPGSLPSSRHHPSESTSAALPRHPLRSVRRRSQPLDGLLLTRAPRFVSPSSRVQGHSSFRDFSLRAARHLRQAALPPCRWRSSALPDLATRLPPSDASASRLCSTRRSVLTGSVLSLASGRFPPRVPSLPGSLTYG